MISIEDYFMGRREQYPLAMGPDIERNAVLIVGLANSLMDRAEQAGVRFQVNPSTKSFVSSGWRPPSVNANTPNAAPNSKHMTGQAIDIYDPEGDLDDWLMTDAGQNTLEELGLWLEHPSASKSWTHVQSIPPRSGKRVFYP